MNPCQIWLFAAKKLFLKKIKKGVDIPKWFCYTTEAVASGGTKEAPKDSEEHLENYIVQETTSQ